MISLPVVYSRIGLMINTRITKKIKHFARGTFLAQQFLWTVAWVVGGGWFYFYLISPAMLSY